MTIPRIAARTAGFLVRAARIIILTALWRFSLAISAVGAFTLFFASILTEVRLMSKAMAMQTFLWSIVSIIVGFGLLVLYWHLQKRWKDKV